MHTDQTHGPKDIPRFSGAGVLMSRKLIKQVPLADVITAIQVHDAAAKRSFETDQSTTYFESVRRSSNGIEFHIASDQSEMLVSAYLPDETSGLPPRAAR